MLSIHKRLYFSFTLPHLEFLHFKKIVKELYKSRNDLMECHWYVARAWEENIKIYKKTQRKAKSK